MASHVSRSTAETSNSNAIHEVNSYEQEEQLLLQANQEFVTVFLDLRKDVANNEKLLECVDNYFVNTLKTPEFCEALQQRLNPTNNSKSHIHQGVSDPFIVHHFSHHLSCLYRQQLMMRETLQSFGKSFDERLDCIDTWKKVSAVFFTAAAAITAAVATANAEVAVAAAAASILLVALGKWIHSLVEKRESAVKRHKEVLSVMTIGVKIAIKHLRCIHVLSRRLQFETESISEKVDDRKKASAVKKSFEELRRKANDYSRNMKWARQVVLQSIIKHYLD